MSTPLSMRRPKANIRRAQSERFTWDAWDQQVPAPHMVGMSQGIMQGPWVPYQIPFVFLPVVPIREEEIMLNNRLAAFLSQAEPERSRSLNSNADSHVYESLISQFSEKIEENKEKDEKIETAVEPCYEKIDATTLRCSNCNKLKPPKSQSTEHLKKPEKVLSNIKSTSTESIFTTKSSIYTKACQKLLSIFKIRKKSYQEMECDEEIKEVSLDPLCPFDKTQEKYQDKSTQVTAEELQKPNFSTLDPLRPPKDSKPEARPVFARNKSISLVNLCDLGSETSATEDKSIYSSISEVCPWIQDSDSLVFVFKPRPENYPEFNVLNKTDLLKSRFEGSSGLGSSGSDFSCEDKRDNPGLTISSGGNLKFDYSWSWSHLNNIVTPLSSTPQAVS